MRWVPAVVLMLASCTPEPTAITTPTTAPVTTSMSRQMPAEVCLTGDEPFFPDGGIGAIPPSGADASVITSIRWQEFANCERLEIELGTEGGAPALASPAVAGFFIRSAGVLRVTVGSLVTASHVSDQEIDTTLVNKIFVVRSPDGSVFVDIHLAAPALARVSSARSPGRVIVDLRPGGATYANPALATPSVVVVEPAGGNVTYPFSVGGYVRGDVPLVEASLKAGDGEVETAGGPPAVDADLWRSFVILFPNGPLGSITLDINGLTEVELQAG